MKANLILIAVDEINIFCFHLSTFIHSVKPYLNRRHVKRVYNLTAYIYMFKYPMNWNYYYHGCVRGKGKKGIRAHANSVAQDKPVVCLVKQFTDH